ncbi:MAG: GNAT family N-acetyltransferase [Acidobacteria bacterium]|nr:GNAT family N-acetyltransferase [Acidobacteriota bacterium]
MPNLESISIRTATSADIPALHALIEASVRGLQANDYTPAQIEGALGHALGLDSQLIADQTYFVAETHGRIIIACGGWSFRSTLCGGDHLPGRQLTALDPAHDAAKIRAIYVHPHWSRRGLGTMILAHCEQQAYAAGFHTVEMGSTLTGVPLYTLRGYRECNRSTIALPNSEGLIIVHMNKRLQAASK